MKAVKLALLPYYKQFQMKPIHFQIYNTLALCYLVKMARGGDQKQVFDRISKRDLEVSPTSWDHNYRRIPSKLHERGDSLAHKILKRPFRVETPSKNISENLSDHRKTKNGSICFLTVCTTSLVHCMETRFIQSGKGCNAANLV